MGFLLWIVIGGQGLTSVTPNPITNNPFNPREQE